MGIHHTVTPKPTDIAAANLGVKAYGGPGNTGYPNAADYASLSGLLQIKVDSVMRMFNKDRPNLLLPLGTYGAFCEYPSKTAAGKAWREKWLNGSQLPPGDPTPIIEIPNPGRSRLAIGWLLAAPPLTREPIYTGTERERYQSAPTLGNALLYALDVYDGTFDQLGGFRESMAWTELQILPGGSFVSGRWAVRIAYNSLGAGDQYEADEPCPEDEEE